MCVGNQQTWQDLVQSIKQRIRLVNFCARKILIIFFLICVILMLNELPHRDASFEYPQLIIWLRNMMKVPNIEHLNILTFVGYTKKKQT